MADRTSTSPKVGHFVRFNALSKRGWLAVLKKQELALWHAYEMHADSDGFAFPDGATLAHLIGHETKGSIGRVRKSLVNRGLLEIVKPASGRGNRCEVRLLDPPEIPSDKAAADANKGRQFADLFGGGGDAERSANRDKKVGKLNEKGRQTEQHHKEEQPREQPREQPSVSADKPRDGSVDTQTDSSTDAGAEGPSKRSASGRVGQDPADGQYADRDASEFGNAGVEGRGQRAVRERQTPAKAPKKPSKRAAAGTERKLTAEQQTARVAFSDWWNGEAWPAHRGGGARYQFSGRHGGRNARAVLEILESEFVAWDLDRAKAVAAAFLDEPDRWLEQHGYVLWHLAERINRFTSVAHARMNGANTHERINRKPTASERGHFAEPQRATIPDLPD